jgi:hypothetical protein
MTFSVEVKQLQLIKYEIHNKPVESLFRELESGGRIGEVVAAGVYPVTYPSVNYDITKFPFFEILAAGNRN